MDKRMLYQYMEKLLDIKANVEAIKCITEFAIEGAKTKENEKSEQLFMCYHVYLDSIERELKGCINDIDSTIAKCARVGENAA